MINQTIKIGGCILMLTLGFSLPAAAEKFTVDSESYVAFKVEHAVGLNTGVINKMTGSINVDKNTGQIQEITLEGDVNSLNSFYGRRDELLKSDKFFDAAKYPTVTLRLFVTKDNKKRAELTVKGVTKSIPIMARLVGFRSSSSGAEEAQVNLTGYFNRADFGMDHNVAGEDGQPILGEEIEFFISVHGKK